MSSVVADTHTIVWYLANDARLSQTAMRALDLASAGGEPIYVLRSVWLSSPILWKKGGCRPSRVIG
jgi:PIN domain nuclease of toxin-antitoxin system